jgi:NAD(P)-dependent dehydrogenase (short-subunit alcohol dehydrogenase family)
MLHIWHGMTERVTPRGVTVAVHSDIDSSQLFRWPGGQDLERKGSVMPSWNKKILWAATGGIGCMLAARALVRRFREYDLRNKTVLITGGSRGLGLIMARQMLQQGAHVAIIARDGPELTRARNYLGPDDERVLSVACDITNRDQVEAMVHTVQQSFGQIHVLINNAGTIQVGPAELMTLKDYEDAMSVHFWGPLYSILAVLPGMRQRREGRIVNISSIGGKVSVPHLLPYNASKFALVGLSEELRAELAKDGIVVTTVCPGLMRTGSPSHASFKGRHRAEYSWFSITGALPLLSQSAERAARQIIAACKRGDAEVVLSLPAKLAVLVHGILPGGTADLLGLANTVLLPSPNGPGTTQVPGGQGSSALSPSWLTTLSERAARRYNEDV